MFGITVCFTDLNYICRSIFEVGEKWLGPIFAGSSFVTAVELSADMPQNVTQFRGFNASCGPCGTYVWVTSWYGLFSDKKKNTDVPGKKFLTTRRLPPVVDLSRSVDPHGMTQGAALRVCWGAMWVVWGCHFALLSLFLLVRPAINQTLVIILRLLNSYRESPTTGNPPHC